MKKVSLILSAILLVMFVFSSCKKETGFSEDSLPRKFKVNIPSAISSSTSTKSISADQASGDDIYQHLRFFIAIGEGAADIVQNIIYGINEYDLSKSMSFSFVSDDDGRTKNVTIVENSEFNGETWMYQLTLTDALEEGGDHDGIGMQVFWNNNPVKGIAILYPYNVNRADSTEDWNKAMFSIEYSEAGEYGYEQNMIVSIADLPVEATEIYALDGMKMFVGKTGDVVDVYGNSAHPNAYFFNSGKGFDWAFVASANELSNLAVAEVGLPPYDLDESSRKVLLEDYSVRSVFTTLISDWYYAENGSQIDSLTLAYYLGNAEAPGFFNQNGFIGSGDAPTTDYDALVTNIEALSPYNPLSIANLTVEFKQETAK